MIRLFIALPLPAEIERELGEMIGRFKPASNSVKWVRPENIHLTVKFLGDTDEKLVEPIGQAIDRIAAEYQPIEAAIDSLGAFPNLRRARVIWVGSAQPIPEASEIAMKVDRAVQKLGFEQEKRGFKAHLTLGRVRQGKRIDRLAEQLGDYRFDPIPLRLDRLTLFKSTLTPQGAIYDRLHETGLGRQEFSG